MKKFITTTAFCLTLPFVILFYIGGEIKSFVTQELLPYFKRGSTRRFSHLLRAFAVLVVTIFFFLKSVVTKLGDNLFRSGQAKPHKFTFNDDALN